jgi:predicted NBD/HSP70 family sugar kinase
VAGPVTVDNDVNWAARAERAHAGEDFAYLYLGEGLGCAMVAAGEVVRGRSGLAGEIAHLMTTGPDGRAMPLIEAIGRLGVRLPRTTAIDADALLAADRRAVGAAVAGVVAAIVALADPGLVVVGGTWGPALLGAIEQSVSEHARAVPLKPAAVTNEPALTGARRDALEQLRAAVVGDAAQDGPGSSRKASVTAASSGELKIE